MANSWRDTAFNMGRPNTRDAEMFPWISHNEQKLYFTRRMRNTDEDFFTTEVDSCGGWFTGRNMGRPANTLNQEAAQMISADGHYLFFMRCENRSENGWGQGGCDLYMAYTADSVWSVPQSFGATINTPGYEGMPCLSADNRELYFVSDREGGYGGMDIWISKFQNGLWQPPRNAGPQINTSGNESAPFLHIDNHTFYFASDGHPGLGGTDLFITRKTGDTTWQMPVNMGYPINTTVDESSLSINTSGNKIFFASDRDSIAGNFDLYEMKLPEKLRPVPVRVVKGYVSDSLTGGRLSYASIWVSDPATEEPLYHFVSNRGDGSFMITLPVGRMYKWHTDRISYKDGEDIIDLSDQDSTNVPYAYSIALLPADYIVPVKDITVLTILFPKRGTSLSDTDKATIQRALSPWATDKEGLHIQVNGYTDNSGTPLINEELSHMRASLVAREIIDMGFDPLAVHTEGWAEADPVAPNDTEEGMQMNRRVEVIIRR
jgi:outer membrane protein OmpA-like peptidoglycan-associated protein